MSKVNVAYGEINWAVNVECGKTEEGKKQNLCRGVPKEWGAIKCPHGQQQGMSLPSRERTRRRVQELEWIGCGQMPTHLPAYTEVGSQMQLDLWSPPDLTAAHGVTWGTGSH